MPPCCTAHFNPRAPCGARLPAALRRAWLLAISIHAPLAGRDLCVVLPVIEHLISIHAPLAGRDRASATFHHWRSSFQSTRPLRGATSHRLYRSCQQRISIHAPLAGRDLSAFTGCASAFGFQSTRPLRGATESKLPASYRQVISIHAPLAGRDVRGRSDPRVRGYFNPRAPCGARHGHDAALHRR